MQDLTQTAKCDSQSEVVRSCSLSEMVQKPPDGLLREHWRQWQHHRLVVGRRYLTQSLQISQLHSDTTVIQNVGSLRQNLGSLVLPVSSYDLQRIPL